MTESALIARECQDGFPWDIGVFDAHCHPTDTMSSIDTIPGMKTKALAIMATRKEDQDLIAQTADRYGVKDPASLAHSEQNKNGQECVIPCFGWHPWYSHEMFDEAEYDNKNTLDRDAKIKHYTSVLSQTCDGVGFFDGLPNPRPLAKFISETKEYLQRYPLALVGEIGLDKAFRLPEPWTPEALQSRDDSHTPGAREGRRLSPYRVQMGHQKKVLVAQLALAGEMQRAVSVHGVSAHGVLFEILQGTWKGHEKQVLSKRQQKMRQDELRHSPLLVDELEDHSTVTTPKPYPPRICLHSYSGPPETVKQYFSPSIPVDFFLSFSSTINFSLAQDKSSETIKAVPAENILVESDLHIAGPRMDAQIEDVTRKVCELKGWELSEGVRRLGENWRRFVFGLDYNMRESK